MATEFAKGNAKSKTPGTWWPIFKGRYMLACPNCGAYATLDHAVDEHGVVSPSLVCPNNCGFHESGVVLKDFFA